MVETDGIVKSFEELEWFSLLLFVAEGRVDNEALDLLGRKAFLGSVAIGS